MDVGKYVNSFTWRGDRHERASRLVRIAARAMPDAVMKNRCRLPIP
jgi:hypothetical protein